MIELNLFQETTAGKTNTPRLSQTPSSWAQEDVYPSKDIRQNKAVFNPITQELRFMPEQVETLIFLYLSFIFFFKIPGLPISSHGVSKSSTLKSPIFDDEMDVKIAPIGTPEKTWKTVMSSVKKAMLVI